MGAIRRELDRYPPQLITLSRPLPGDSWGRPEPRAVLPPIKDPRHPYRVAVALPPWVLADDPELRRWLFSYGAAIRLEGPRALVEEQRRWLQEALAALEPARAAEHDEECAGCSAAAGRRPRKQRRSSASGAAHPCPLCGSPWVPLAPLG
jgi:hypothetical protein